MEEHDSRAAPLSTRPLRVLALTAAAAAAATAAGAVVVAASVSAVAVTAAAAAAAVVRCLALRTRLSPSVRARYSVPIDDVERACRSKRSADLHTANS